MKQRISIPIRFSTQHQHWLYMSFSVLWASGVLWLLFHYFASIPGRFGERPHILEYWWLRVHGISMMLSLLMLGTTIVHHAHKAWRLNKNRQMGGLLTLTLGWLSITGYALYYFSDDNNGTWLPQAHWLPGLLFPLILIAHIQRGRCRKSTKTSITYAGNHTQTASQHEP